MVVGSHFVAGSELTAFYLVELVAEVVASVSANGAPVEIFSAYRTHQHWCGAQGASFFHILAQIVLIGAAGCSSTIVAGICLCLIADALIVSFQLVAVASVALLVVVGKLNEHVVTWLYLFLHRLPVGALLIEALAAGTILGTVVHGDITLEELLEHLSPASRHGGVRVIGRHSAVAYGMHLSRLHT